MAHKVCLSAKYRVSAVQLAAGHNIDIDIDTVARATSNRGGVCTGSIACSLLLLDQ